MKRFGFRSVMRLLLVTVALVIILGAVGLTILNSSLSWDMLSRRVELEINEGSLSVSSTLELDLRRGLFTGFLINPSLSVDSISVGGQPVSYRRIASLVFVRTSHLRALADDVVVLDITASGTPINPPSEGTNQVVEIKDDYLILAPNSVWLPQNGKPKGRLDVQVTAPVGWRTIMPGRLLGSRIENGQEISDWLVPADMPTVFSGHIEAFADNGDFEMWSLERSAFSREQQHAIRANLEQGMTFVGASTGATTSQVVFVSGNLTGSWANLFTINRDEALDSTRLLRTLGRNEWSPYFQAGSKRNWLADSLVNYLAILYGAEQGDYTLREAMGQLGADYAIYDTRGRAIKLNDLASAVDDFAYERMGLPKATFFWHRLHSELGDELWERFLHDVRMSGQVHSAGSMLELANSLMGGQLLFTPNLWLSRAQMPSFYIGNTNLTTKDGQQILQVVVWQRRPFFAGHVTVRAYGANGESAEVRLPVRVISELAEIPVDFDPVAVMLDPDNEWLNSYGGFQKLSPAAMVGPREMAIIYLNDPELADEVNEQARTSAQELANLLKGYGIRVETHALQNLTWARLSKADVVLLAPEGVEHPLWLEDWERATFEDASLVVNSKLHPQSTHQGVWDVRGLLPQTESEWSLVLQAPWTSVAYGPQYDVIDYDETGVWLKPTALYKIIKDR